MGVVGPPPLLVLEVRALEAGPSTGRLAQVAGASAVLAWGARAPLVRAAPQPVEVASQATALCMPQTVAAGAPRGGPGLLAAAVVGSTAAGLAGPAIQTLVRGADVNASGGAAPNLLVVCPALTTYHIPPLCSFLLAAGGGGGSSWVTSAFAQTVAATGTTPTTGQPGFTASAGAVRVVSVSGYSLSPAATSSSSVLASRSLVASRSPSPVPSSTSTLSGMVTSTRSPGSSPTPSPTGVCPAGSYCPGGVGSSTPPQVCPAGWWCRAGQTAWNVNKCGRGYFCPAGSSAPIACPARNVFDASFGGVANGAWRVVVR